MSLLDNAKKYIGMTEKRNSDVLNSLTGVNVQTTPWCAAFINALLSEVNITGTGSNLARSFLKWEGGVSVDPREAEPGDIVIFRRGNTSWQGHVAILKSPLRASDEYAIVIGGNQGDMVKVSGYPVRDILGIRRIKQ